MNIFKYRLNIAIIFSAIFIIIIFNTFGNFPFYWNILFIYLSIFIIILNKNLQDKSPFFFSFWGFLFTIQTVFGYFSFIYMKEIEPNFYGNINLALEYAFYAINYFILGYVILKFGYFIFELLIQKKKEAVKNNVKFDRNKTKLWLISLSLIYLLFNFLNFIILKKIPLIDNVGVSRISMNSNLDLMYRITFFLALIIATLSISINIFKVSKNKFYIIFGFLILFIQALYGARMDIFFPVITIITILIIKNKLKVFHLISGFLIFLLLSQSFIALRGKIPFNNVEQIYKETMIQSFQEFRDFSDFITLFKKPADYYHGKSFLIPLVTPFPKRILEVIDVDKDQILSYNSARVFMIKRKTDSGQRVGIIGEFYMNFGTTGVNIGFFIIGLLTAILDLRQKFVLNNDLFILKQALLMTLLIYSIIGQFDTLFWVLWLIIIYFLLLNKISLQGFETHDFDTGISPV